MRPVVFVHGFMGGSRQWRDQSDIFRGAQTCMVDLPGYGENAHLDAFDCIVDTAEWVLDQLAERGIETFHLLGHSMGGMVAQEMVARAPARVDRLVLYGTGAVGVLPGRFESIETSKERAHLDGAEATARRIAGTWFLDGQTAPAYSDCADLAARSSLQALDAGLEAMRLWDGESNLPLIKAPTLVVWGDHDRTYPWSQIERLWREIPDARLAVIPDCAHAAHLEAPDLFNGIVRRFLAA